jgi:hypothetical protein
VVFGIGVGLICPGLWSFDLGCDICRFLGFPEKYTLLSDTRL